MLKASYQVATRGLESLGGGRCAKFWSREYGELEMVEIKWFRVRERKDGS